MMQVLHVPLYIKPSKYDLTSGTKIAMFETKVGANEAVDQNKHL